MKNPEVLRLEVLRFEVRCEQMQAALDKIKKIVWEPNTTLPAVKHKVALVLKDVAR